MFRDIERMSSTEKEIFAIIVLIAIVVLVFFLITLQNCLKNVSPENRKMPPANVWLMFIPFFSLIYQFIMVGNIADSLEAEFKKRGIDPGEARPGYSVGLAFCILTIASQVFARLGEQVAVLGSIIGIAGIVCMIIYWVKISNYSKQISASQDDNILDRNM